MDSKQSPLALLAQTCNNIGKDATTNQLAKSHLGGSKPALQSPQLGASPAASPNAAKPTSAGTGKVMSSSPSAVAGKRLSTSSAERESPSSTCTPDIRKSARRLDSGAMVSPDGKYSSPASPRQSALTVDTETTKRLSPGADRLPDALDSMDGAAGKAAAQTLFQLKTGGMLPDLVHPTALLSGAGVSAAAAATAAAAFGLSPPGATPDYRSYTAAGLPWPTGLLAPAAPHVTNYRDSQCGQCSAHHQPGFGTCTCKWLAAFCSCSRFCSRTLLIYCRFSLLTTPCQILCGLLPLSPTSEHASVAQQGSRRILHVLWKALSQSGGTARPYAQSWLVDGCGANSQLWHISFKRAPWVPTRCARRGPTLRLPRAFIPIAASLPSGTPFPRSRRLSAHRWYDDCDCYSRISRDVWWMTVIDLTLQCFHFLLKVYVLYTGLCFCSLFVHFWSVLFYSNVAGLEIIDGHLTNWSKRCKNVYIFNEVISVQSGDFMYKIPI